MTRVASLCSPCGPPRLPTMPVPTQPLVFTDQALAPNVKIHPVVLFSIIDHYTRRNEGQERVIGTLLGTVRDGEIEVRNCFPVPHNETEEQVFVNMEFHSSMIELHRKVNPKEVIVGWYATGNEITQHSVLIHEFYGREAEIPVHLTVNTDLKKENMAISCYTSSPLGTPSNPTGTVFTPINSEIVYVEAERVGVDLLERSKDSPTGLMPLVTEMDYLESAVTNMMDMLNTISDYVNQVLEGRISADNAIGRYLLDVVTAVPVVDATLLEKLYNNSLQDLLMVVYLTNLTKTQMALAEKLYTTL